VSDHGTRTSYTHGGCREACCQKPNAEYVASYRAKTRRQSSVKPAPSAAPRGERMTPWEQQLRRAAAESADW